MIDKILPIAGLLGIVFGTSVLADPGILYGTVMTRDQKQLTGALRWDDEESLWIQHFNGNKASAADLTDLSAADRTTIAEHQPGPQFQIGGHTVEFIKFFGSSELQPQSFAIEFGSIAELRPSGGQRLTLTLQDGTVIEADGGSNDIGADIYLKDQSGGIREFGWRDIEAIEFSAAPIDAPRFEPNLYGTVRTIAGDFSGFVVWDNDERTGAEELDGEENGSDLSLPFASIASITKEDQGSRVVTLSGASHYLTGSNDVNHENRGIVVTTANWGELAISWTAFESVVFETAPVAATYASFQVGALTGSVTTNLGDTLTGNLLFDVDEAHLGESIVGYYQDIEFTIPLRLIASIHTQDARSSRVLLHNGNALLLGRGRDVTASNNGVIVDDGTRPRAYIAWDQVQSVVLAR